MVDVSVIIPVYNVEAYIRSTLSSVTNQTYPNIEIILVDDGSTDASGLICDEIALEDQRVTVIHKQNEGVGYARNTGMDIAKGEYLYFCDADDLIEKDLIKDNLSLAKKHDADIVEFGYRLVYQSNDANPYKYMPQVLPGLNGVYTYREFTENFCDECRLGNMLVCRLYRREYIVKNGLRQSNMRVGEDAMFIYETYKHPFNKLVANPKSYYNYIRRSGTATTKYDPERFKYESIVVQGLKAAIDSFGFNDGRYESLIYRKYVVLFNLSVANLAQANISFRDKLLILKKEAKRPEILKAFKKVQLNNSFTKSTKIKILLLRWRQYRLVLKLGEWKSRAENRG